MSKDTLDTLRHGAQYIKLQPSTKYGGAVELDNLLDVLSSFQASFSGFIEAQFSRTYHQSVQEKYRKELKKIKQETKLLIVDLHFNSYETAISPDLVTHHFEPTYLKIDTWKKEKFEEYKEEAFHLNYNSKAFINRIREKYSDEERNRIFKPIIENLQNTKGYTIYFGDYKHKYENTFQEIKDESIELLVPRLEKEIVKKDEKIVHVFYTTKDEITLFGKVPKVDKLLYIKEEQHQIYPYVTKEIKYSNYTISLKNDITVNVDFDEDEKFFLFTYEDLSIRVWGDTREDATEAFNFAFVALYENYVITKDKLTKEAKELGGKISSLIATITNEG